MSTTNNTYKTEPLNEENYVAWRRRLEWILDDLDLWAVTNGTEKEPTPVDPRTVTKSEQTVIDEWKKKDKKAKKEICLRISDEYLVYVDQNTNMPDLWRTLRSIFESKAAIGTVNIRQEFFQMFTEDGANMEEHVWKLHGLYQQLSA